MAKAPRKSIQSIRLNKYLSESGAASRRRADEYINAGRVMVNGKKVFELGTRVVPGVDRVHLDGKPVKEQTSKVYIMFHKPKNIVTTMEDPEGRPTIADFFRKLPVRVFPVGRLDWDTEGLILLTNDGDFSQKVMHPKEEIPKTYLAKVSGHPSDDQLRKLVTGVSIIGGKVAAKSVERIKRGADKYDWVKIVITEGKNRQVRLMFEKIGYDVMKLQRVAIGKLKLGSLKRGEFVSLTAAGVARIFEVDRPSPGESRDQTTREEMKGQRGGKAVAAKPIARDKRGRPLMTQGRLGPLKPEHKSHKGGRRSAKREDPREVKGGKSLFRRQEEE